MTLPHEKRSGPLTNIRRIRGNPGDRYEVIFLDQQGKFVVTLTDLHFLLILFVFVGLGSLNALFASFAPTMTITITPDVKTVSMTATVSVGVGADIEGRILPPAYLKPGADRPGDGQGTPGCAACNGNADLFQWRVYAPDGGCGNRLYRSG
jgi:hypothetical protein